MFRNLTLFRLHGAWPESEQELSNKLLNVAFTPCGSLTERSSGWEAPGGETQSLLARRVGGADLLRLRSQTRLLPTAAINEALEERVRAEPRGQVGGGPSPARAQRQACGAASPLQFARSCVRVISWLIIDRKLGFGSHLISIILIKS